MRQNSFPRGLAIASGTAALPGAPGTTTVVHVLDIACPIGKLREVMGDAQRWLPWTVPTLQSVQPLPFGQWLLKTPRHLLKLRRYSTTTLNELCYEMLLPNLGSCQALVNLGATHRGCQLTLTLQRRQLLPLPAFTTSVHHTFSGLQTLKLVMERD